MKFPHNPAQSLFIAHPENNLTIIISFHKSLLWDIYVLNANVRSEEKKEGHDMDGDFVMEHIGQVLRDSPRRGDW